MSASPETPALELTEEALALLVRTHDLPSSSRDRFREEWRRRSAAHALALNRAEAEWGLFSEASDKPLDVIDKVRLFGETIIASAIDHPARSAGVLCLLVAFIVTPLVIFNASEDSRIASGSFQKFSMLPHTAEYADIADRFRTERGEQREIELPDGARLWLNWNSEVLIAEFDDEVHVDVLLGDALFSVPGDRERPLVIHAGEAVVHAPDTEFAIHTHGPQDALFQVRRGVVTVAGAAEAAARKIGPAQQSYYLNGEGRAIQRASFSSIAAWREGMLIFDDRPLTEVLYELSHYTQRTVRVGTIVQKSETVSGIYSIEEADQALMQIADAYGLELVKAPEGDVIVRSIDARRL